MQLAGVATRNQNCEINATAKNIINTLTFSLLVYDQTALKPIQFVDSGIMSYSNSGAGKSYPQPQISWQNESNLIVGISGYKYQFSLGMDMEYNTTANIFGSNSGFTFVHLTYWAYREMVCPEGYNLNQSNVANFTCVEICGDGKLFNLECDDGNTVSEDGCSSTCTV